MATKRLGRMTWHTGHCIELETKVPFYIFFLMWWTLIQQLHLCYKKVLDRGAVKSSIHFFGP